MCLERNRLMRIRSRIRHSGTPGQRLAQIKRWITTAEAMDRFQFDWAKIKRWDVPLASLGLQDGPDISWP
jgi:hypothetical protein